MKTIVVLALLFSSPTYAHDNSAEMLGASQEESIPPMTGSDQFQGTLEQVRKFYSKGTLFAASLLPADTFGLVKIHRPRNRGYGSFDMVEMLKATAAQLQASYPSRDRIMVGDISVEQGGEISGHASHQNGLDADVAFIRLNQTEQDPDYTGGFEETFVKNGRIAPNFDHTRNWAYAKLLIGTGRVQRLFVNEVVKKSLCKWAKAMGELESARETLKRLRTISGHTDHFHVRITCPRNSPTCEPQDDMKDETGC